VFRTSFLEEHPVGDDLLADKDESLEDEERTDLAVSGRP